MYASVPTTLSSSLTHIEHPRIDHAALDEQHRARQARARLFPDGSRVFVDYRLDHQPHPYQPLYSPQQRTPLGAVCRYAGPSFMSTDYYDVENDQVVDTAYHTVISADGKTYRVLAGDLRGVEITPVFAAVPACIPPVCRALLLVEPLRQVLLRLVAHVALIVRSADRSLYAENVALHVGQHATLTPTSRGVQVCFAGRDTLYPLRVSLAALRRLVKTLRARLAAAEEARFFADLVNATRGQRLSTNLIPRDGSIHLQAAGQTRLLINVGPGIVTLRPHVNVMRAADGQAHPAWITRYHFSPVAVELHRQIAALIS